ncbi:hypothetical protein B2K_39545 [Paenibacillus mucilaginosus K02]|uniref:Uncharacterized protein n=1 Tax=Paenibacillus mucilaginosus K02 TaxID=997761 RepID=R9UPY4_9BACL|nr:hypothetical protein B2K_39545 [Paenibacillus mucilaginosus K02]
MSLQETLAINTKDRRAEMGDLFGRIGPIDEIRSEATCG